MSYLFDPAIRNFQGISKPTRDESDVVALEVTGTLPPQLRGSYYRVGPDPTYVPLHRGFHATDGNGKIAAFRFHDGQVDYRTRYVRTERFELERAANRALFGAYRNPYTDDPSIRDRTIGREISRGTANTTVRWHAGVLWALKEDSPGVEVEPISLRTRGPHDFGGAMTSRTMTAHPKIDAATGEMVFFGAAAKGETTPDIALYTADAGGKITKEEWITPPYASMMHDFAVSANWIVFPVMPTVSSLDRIRAGGPIYDWDPGRSAFIGVLPRSGTAADVRWIEVDPLWSYHTMNATEDDRGRLLVDLMQSAVQPFPFFHVDPGRTWSPQAAAPYLHRWTIDPVAGTFTSERLAERSTEFPRMDERFELGRYRHGYALVNDPARPALAPDAGGPPGNGGALNCLGHYDMATGGLDLAYAGDGATFEEPQFVPRSPGAPEGDGFLIALRHHHDTLTSDLVVYDTGDVTGDPAAVVHVPIRVKPGIHGCWVDAAEEAAALA